jgi:hypothetical protein
MKNPTRRLSGVFLLATALLLGAGAARAQEQTNIVERADQVLRAASQYLAQAPQFTFTAEIWREHVTDSGQKLQFTREMEMHVKRPDRLHAEIKSPRTGRGFYYDGKSLTIVDRKRNLFSTVPMPATLDAALDQAQEEFGVDLPLIDFAISDPYRNATARVESGRYFGVSPVLGVDCDHLAFTQENIDWQLWVESGARPLIRKLVITHKNEEGSPEFIALITHWDITDPVSPSDFVFQQPAGAAQVQMRKIEAQTGTGRSSSPASEPSR